MPMVHGGYKTLVRYPDGTSKVITLYVQPLEGQVIAHGWEVTTVATGGDDALGSGSRTRSRSYAPQSERLSES